MTNEEKAAELMYRYHKEIGVTTYDILMEMAEFMTDKACEWLLCHACLYGYADADLGNAEYHYNAEPMIKALRKAMEE